jgi:hypothetical protein
MSYEKRKPAIDESISSAALKNLSNMSANDFVKHLATRGIHSLEDLAKVSIGTAKGALQGGLAFVDPDLFPVCYKFTVKPHVLETEELNKIDALIEQTAFRR